MAKAANPVPAGFHTVTVHLAVNGAAAYSDFLQRAFGAVEVDRSPGPGGKLMHVQMKIGDSTIIFADDFSKEFGLPERSRKAMSGGETPERHPRLTPAHAACTINGM